MPQIPLKLLGLQKKWSALAKLEAEVADFEKHLSKAEAEVGQLRAGLGQAREKDLDTEAEAVRAGRKAPDPVHEPALQRKLEAAIRNRDVTQRALDAARADRAEFIRANQSELFSDIVAARREIASRIAESAQAALKDFGKWSDLHYVLKGLQPVAQVDTENSPAQPLTVTTVGVMPAQNTGPARGQVEEMLGYLIGLAGDDEEERQGAA